MMAKRPQMSPDMPTAYKNFLYLLNELEGAMAQRQRTISSSVANVGGNAVGVNS
jgi:hypothetical protein